MTVTAFIPGERYPTISITGKTCAMNCKYCEGYYLTNMHSAITPNELYSNARNLHAKGARGLLISGGYNKDGYMPIKNFLSTIREIKRDFELVISLHSGLVDKKLASEIRKSQVDIVDYQLITDPIVIKEIQGLNRRPKDYIKSLEFLIQYGPSYIAPHLPLGFRYGKIVKERETIDVVKDYNPYLVVFLTFISTPHSSMEDIGSPEHIELADIFSYSRKLPCDIAIGCMRSAIHKKQLDEELIERKLVDRMCLPHSSTIKKYKLNVIKSCCSIPRELIDRFLD